MKFFKSVFKPLILLFIFGISFASNCIEVDICDITSATICINKRGQGVSVDVTCEDYSCYAENCSTSSSNNLDMFCNFYEFGTERISFGINFQLNDDIIYYLNNPLVYRFFGSYDFQNQTRLNVDITRFEESNKKICNRMRKELGLQTTDYENIIKDISRYDNNGSQSDVLTNGFTREFNNAYQFAYRNGITTMMSIEYANMNGNLNRIAMAKMLSQYAINILGKQPDTNKNCNFGDVSSQIDNHYDNGVTLACQLGIMGVNMTNFRPNDDVTRAEFGTALSRILFGLADGTDNYYTTHLAKLKEEGIISNDDPILKELRGYVMLMLMRSAK